MKSRAKDKKDLVSTAFDKCRSAFVSAGLVSCAINLLMLTGPLFMLQIYDRVQTSRSTPTLLALATLTMGLFVFYGLFELIRSRILVRTGRQIEEHLRAPSFDMIIERKVAQDRTFGTQPVKDMTTVRKFLAGPGLTAMFDMPWAPLYVLVIFLMHPLLGVAATIAILILFVIALVNHGATRKPLADANQSTRSALASAEENRRNAEIIRVLGMQGAMRERWMSKESDALGQHTRGMDLSSITTSSSRALRLMFQSGMLGLGAWLAIRQEISAGTIIAASIIMARALSPVEVSVSQWPAFLAFREAVARLRLAFPAKDDNRPPMSLPPPEGQLSVIGLTAFAPRTNAVLVSQISFDLEPGTVLGIIGPTGAGKSTLVRSIAGLWPRVRGEVRLDGATLDQWDPDDLGRYIGYLPQDIELFDGPVAENISRFYPDATSEAVIRAAKLADVHDLVLKMPEGYRTVIGEEGASLSAGQRQRIGLARALYGDPVLVIMDEPNSNLDNVGEAALVNAINALKERGTTVVVVAHRPSALAAADYILVVMEGQQVAFGPRDEVLKSHLKPVPKIKAGNAPVLIQDVKDNG